MITIDEAERLLTACRLAGNHPDELRLLRAEVREVEEFKSGTSVTYKVTFGDGSLAAFKPIEGVETSAAGYGHTAASVILNDFAAWLVARGLGFDDLIRGVVISTCPEPGVGIGSWQTWLDGDPSGQGWEQASQLRQAGLFDSVVGQQDRNGTNFHYDQQRDRLGLFDQSFTFPLPGHATSASVFLDYLHGAGEADVDDDLGRALDRLDAAPEHGMLSSVLAPDRYARMEERIALIRSQGKLLSLGEY